MNVGSFPILCRGDFFLFRSRVPKPLEGAERRRVTPRLLPSHVTSSFGCGGTFSLDSPSVLIAGGDLVDTW